MMNDYLDEYESLEAAVKRLENLDEDDPEYLILSGELGSAFYGCLDVESGNMANELLNQGEYNSVIQVLNGEE